MKESIDEIIQSVEGKVEQVEKNTMEIKSDLRALKEILDSEQTSKSSSLAFYKRLFEE